MEPLLKWVVKVIHLIIIGVFYLLDLVALILVIFSKEILILNINYKDYKVLIVLVVLLVSFIVGFVINKASQRIIWLKWPEHKKRFEKLVESVSANKKEELGGYYLDLIMIRHLLLSIPSLGILITIYFLKFEYYGLSLFLFIAFTIFSIFIFFAYKQQKIQNKIIVVRK